MVLRRRSILAHEANLYDEKESHGIPTVAASLREALEHLDDHRDFLKAGNVFCDELIDGFIDLKMKEVKELEMTPQPLEFQLYYGV